jgi:hypothetical protein
MKATVLLLACGALAHELVALQRRNQWTHVKLQCLPADLHNRPEKIPGAVRAALERWSGEFRHIFVAYADCGTGGHLDTVLEEFGAERIPGPHCYEFYAGHDDFAALADQEPGTLYLTDYLTRNFDRLIKQGLGIEQHPELLEAYFGNYRRVVYLAQTDSDELTELAKSHARYLGLQFEQHRTGLAPLNLLLKEPAATWQN